RHPEWAKSILLLAPLVLVPLGLDLFDSNSAGTSTWLKKNAPLLQLPAALLLAAAFLLQPGRWAALLALPWLMTGGLIACWGLMRACRHLRGAIHELSKDMGLIYLTIGAAWAAAYLFGLRPLDFEEIIVLLTAIHFHYAGFVLPIVAGMCA